RILDTGQNARERQHATSFQPRSTKTNPQGRGVTELLFTRGQMALVPACEEAAEWLKHKRLGSTILVEPQEPRNAAFFRKWWALVKLGYDYWSENVEAIEYKGERVTADFDRFRKDLTILAGHYHPVAN